MSCVCQGKPVVFEVDVVNKVLGVCTVNTYNSVGERSACISYSCNLDHCFAERNRDDRVHEVVTVGKLKRTSSS